MSSLVTDLRVELGDHLRADLSTKVSPFSPENVNNDTVIVEVTEVAWSAHHAIATVEVSAMTVQRGSNSQADMRFNTLGAEVYESCLLFTGASGASWALEPFSTSLDFTALDVPGEGADLAVAVVNGTVLVPRTDTRSTIITGAYTAEVIALLTAADFKVVTAGENPPFVTVRYAGSESADTRYQACDIWCAVEPDTDIEAYARSVWSVCYDSEIAVPGAVTVGLRSAPPASLQVFDVARFRVRQAGGG